MQLRPISAFRALPEARLGAEKRDDDLTRQIKDHQQYPLWAGTYTAERRDAAVTTARARKELMQGGCTGTKGTQSLLQPEIFTSAPLHGICEMCRAKPVAGRGGEM